MLLTSADQFYDLCVRPVIGALNSSPDQIHFGLSAILIVEAYSNWLAAETQKVVGEVRNLNRCQKVNLRR
jgi:hypothetical protein